MARRKEAAEEPQEAAERSALAGAVVVVALGAAGFGALFAWSDAAGILAVWVVATGMVWWSVRRRNGTDQPLPSPTAAPTPGSELPGHGPIAVTRREGMSIFLRDDDTNPTRTHVHVELHD